MRLPCSRWTGLLLRAANQTTSTCLPFSLACWQPLTQMWIGRWRRVRLLTSITRCPMSRRARPPGCRLKKLALKSKCPEPITVELGGLDSGREFFAATLVLPPRETVHVEQGFHSPAYIHPARQPEARLGLHSPLRGKASILPAQAWGNIWVYGMDCILTGWLTHEDYLRKASVLKAGMHTLQYDRTREKNLLVPKAALNLLALLFTHLKEWQEER
jgi:hypothetical protein